MVYGGEIRGMTEYVNHAIFSNMSKNEKQCEWRKMVHLQTKLKIGNSIFSNISKLFLDYSIKNKILFEKIQKKFLKKSPKFAIFKR